MKLTRASSYALHAVVHLAVEGSVKPTASQRIAAEHHIPERFLLKVLKPLVSAGILRGIKGPSGGYLLARPAHKISLLEIIEASDGRIRGEDQWREGSLLQATTAVCDKLADMTRQVLGKVTVAAFVRSKRKGAA